MFLIFVTVSFFWFFFSFFYICLFTFLMKEYRYITRYQRKNLNDLSMQFYKT